jgi:hypothetical protein
MKMGLHPWQYETESRMKATQTKIFDFLKQQKATVEAAEKLPQKSKPVRLCRNCNQPLNAIADCSKHAVEMRNYRTEFDLGCNWPRRLSDATAEEFRLEERERELHTVADSLKGRRDDGSLDKLVRILGRDFRSKITEQITHQDGLLDVVRNRLAEIRSNMPRLVHAVESFLLEEKQVPSEGLIFSQRHRDEKAARILQ